MYCGAIRTNLGGEADFYSVATHKLYLFNADSVLVLLYFYIV